jgi:hypothetical protein
LSFSVTDPGVGIWNLRSYKVASRNDLSLKLGQFCG